MRSTRQQARFAGFLYLLIALSAPIGLMYVPGKLIVSGNATATADNLRASEGLLRIGIASELFHQVIAVFLVLALYRLFKPVNETLAKQLVILGALVSVPVMFINVLNNVAALILVSGADFLAGFEKPELDALAYSQAALTSPAPSQPWSCRSTPRWSRKLHCRSRSRKCRSSSGS